MPGILDIIGLALRGAAALGLVALCGWSSVVLGTGHAALLGLLAQGGQAVLGLMGVIAGFGCLVSLTRDTRRQAGPRQDGFDPDAIIARHMAERAANPPARNGFYQPPRPIFGRRQG